VAGIAKLAALVDAEDQRAEVRSRFPWFAPARDDELLLLKKLELAPIRRTLAGHVARRRGLRDEAFPAVRDGAFVKRAPVAVGNLADAQNG